MKISFVVPVVVSVVSALALVPSLAHAEGAAVTCVAGQFGDHIDHGKAVGDAKTIADAKKVVYSVDMANAGEATQVTLVWKIDGKEIQRQSLDVGQSPHWRTWGTRPLGGAAGSKIEVQVLDASGTSLKEDALTL
jgi:hypothetical protein